MIRFEVDVSGIMPWRKALDAAVFRAARRAGSDAVKAMRTEASRQVRGRKAMRVAYVNKALQLRYPDKSTDTLQWAVQASGGIMPVMAFYRSQSRVGARVEINKGVKRVIPHAFRATMKSGHVGVFMRYGQATRMPQQHGKGHARYRGQKRQPIKELFTTRIPEAFMDSAEAIGGRGKAVFVPAFQRLMQVETKKG